MRKRSHGVLAGLWLLAWQALAAPEVVVEGFMGDAAILRIDGQRELLRAGESRGGVMLLGADGRAATVDIGGERRVLTMSRHIGTAYEEPQARVVTIPRNGQMQYLTSAQINGRGALVMIDTGANIVALSTSHADGLGVDYLAGEPTQVTTASGVAEAWLVNLRSVDVGGIRVDNVEATVIEGAYPATILLGMTYLRHVSMQEQNGVLSLSRPR